MGGLYHVCNWTLSKNPERKMRIKLKNWQIFIIVHKQKFYNNHIPDKKNVTLNIVKEVKASNFYWLCRYLKNA